MTFGEKLRALMAERGIGTRELARLVPCDPGHLSRIRNSNKGVSQRLAERLDELLSADGALAALWRSSIARPSMNGDLTPDHEDRILHAARRPGSTDLTVVESLAAILAEQRRIEDTIGSAPLIPAVRAQLETIDRMVAEARGKTREPLVNVAGQWTQFYGWLCLSVGRLAEASAMLDRALQHAVETDDINLVSEVLGFKAQVAWDSGKIGTMIGLRRAARRDDGRLYPGEAAIAAAQEARGHAALGDAHGTDRLLDLADEFADQARAWHEEIPPWLYYQVDGFYELHRGQAWRHLGQRHPAYNERAIGVLADGLSRLPAEMRDSEWAGDFVYQLACAHRQAGERDRAATLADELAALADRLRSERLARRAAALR